MSNLVTNTSGLSSNNSKMTNVIQGSAKVGIVQNSKVKNNRDDKPKSSTISTKVNIRSEESSLMVSSNWLHENNDNLRSELKVESEKGKGKVSSASGGKLEENAESTFSINNNRNMKKSGKKYGDIMFSADFSMDVRESENENENERKGLQNHMKKNISPRIHLQSDQNITSPNQKNQIEVCRAYVKKCSSENSVDYDDDFEKDSGPCSHSDSDPEPEPLPPSYDIAFSRFDNISDTKNVLGGKSITDSGEFSKNVLQEEKKNSKYCHNNNFLDGSYENHPRDAYRDGKKESERKREESREIEYKNVNNYGGETARKSRHADGHNLISSSSKTNYEDSPSGTVMRKNSADKQQSKNIPSSRIAKNVPPLDRVGNVYRSNSRNRGSARESEFPMTSSRNEISKPESSRSVDSDKSSKYNKSENGSCFPLQSHDINNQREILEQRANERRIRVDTLKKDARDRVNLKLKEEERLLK